MLKMMNAGSVVSGFGFMNNTLSFNPTREECEALSESVMSLLERYNHYDDNKSEEGIDKMYGENGLFWKNKGWLINAFENHANYNGNYQLVFHDADMIRHVDWPKIKAFIDWLDNLKWGEKHDELYYPLCKMIWGLNKYFREDTRTEFFEEGKMEGEKEQALLLDSQTANIFNDAGAYYGVDFRFREGMKLSKVISRMGKTFGLDKIVQEKPIDFTRQDGTKVKRMKDFGWNYRFTQFSDGINPINGKGTLIISINPLDFYTMSFGDTWASCHTIDTENIREVDEDHNYEGMYCAGTESYALDGSTVIVYYLPQDFKGNEPETWDKLKRCVFYVGNDKIIQSRLYPDGRDGGDKSLSGDMRRMVLKVFSELFNLPNKWRTVCGTYTACREIRTAYGAEHYRDYEHYDDVKTSYVLRTEDVDDINHTRIEVGHPTICPNCGDTHRRSERLQCDVCRDAIVTCQNCDHNDYASNMIRYNDEYYCPDCMVSCECCETVIPEYIAYGTENGYVCMDCRDNNNYVLCTLDWLYAPESECIESMEGTWHLLNRSGSNGTYFTCECGEIHDRNYTGRYHQQNCSAHLEMLERERREEEEREERITRELEEKLGSFETFINKYSNEG